MRICIDSDDAGAALKADIIACLIEAGHTVDDPKMTHCGYPDVAHCVARRVSMGIYDRGILICATGLGMAMMANKVPGAWAATPQDIESAIKMARSNEANILTIGSEVTCATRAKGMVLAWLETPFGNRPNARRMKELAGR